MASCSEDGGLLRPKGLTDKELRTTASLMPNSARPHVALGNLLSLKGQDDFVTP
jgi:hypothetical protein